MSISIDLEFGTNVRPQLNPRVNLLECNLMEQGYSMSNIICSCQSTVNMIKTCLLLIGIA